METFQDLELLAEIRQRLESIPSGKHRHDVRMLEKEPLLQSLYAETLRFGVQIHIPRCAPHHDIQIGHLRIPKGKLILINTLVAHNDESVWNTEGVEQPLQNFSGDGTHDSSIGKKDGNIRPREEFSVQGLEGSWIPFGGETSASDDGR
jgi:hypothetical protein